MDGTEEQDYLSVGDLSKVFKAVYDARSKWHNIGLELKINPSDLDAYKVNHKDDPEECFKDVLSNWLKQVDPRPTWAALASALSSPTVGHGQLSEVVKRKQLTMPQMDASAGASASASVVNPVSTDSPPSPLALEVQHQRSATSIEQFKCPCGKCDLLSYLDDQCPKITSTDHDSYPYLPLNNLSDDDREDLIQKLSDDIAEIIQCFADLLSDTSESIATRDISVEKLVNVAFNLGAYKSSRNTLPLLVDDEKELKEAKSIDSVFTILQKHMSFFNYEILGHIVRKLGDEKDNKNLETFCGQFKDFCKRKVFEVPPSVFCPSGHQSKNRRKLFVLLITQDLYSTLADVKAAQRKVASLLGLRSSTVQLKRIDIGSVILVFSIPIMISHEVFPLNSATYEKLKSIGYTLIVPDTPASTVSTENQPSSIQHQISGSPFAPDEEVYHNRVSQQQQPLLLRTDLEKRLSSSEGQRPTYNQKSFHQSVESDVLYQKLTVENYKNKFRELIQCEQNTHAELLRDRCDGEYKLTITSPGVVRKLKLSRSPHHKDYYHSAYLSMDGDTISYVIQAAQPSDGVKLMVNRGEICSADIILQENYMEEKLYIGFSRPSANFFKLERSEFNAPILVKVNFDLKRSYFDNLTKSVIDLSKSTIQRIMLDKSHMQLEELSTHHLSNHYEKLCSPDQLEGLKAITFTPSISEPVVIIGPFGTGKTRILALASHFLFSNPDKQSNILVCTHQRVSADTFLETYLNLKHELPHETDVKILLVRDYGVRNRHLAKYYVARTSVENNISQYGQHLIIITCLTARHLAGTMTGFFTHIMIDEAAQMREPEAVAPLCLADNRTRIIIAGDPLQVGPSIEVLGDKAIQNGLSVSLLERLYLKYNMEEDKTNVKLPLVTLVTNFRCHPDILHLTRTLFYATPLRRPESRHAWSQPYSSDSPGIEFVCSDLDEKVQEVKQAINELEANIILKQLMMKIDHRNWPKEYGDYDLNKICIMTQSRRQLSLFKYLITKRQYQEVRCFSTYDIQGREFQALFLSTSETTAPDGSTKNPTKSLSNPFVFNTALTRAQSLVVSVGNPFLLLKMERHMIRKYGDMGKCWSTYLKFCLERQTFMFHYPPSNKEAVLAHLREMITANEQLSGDFQSSCEMKKDQSNYMRISHTQANHTHGNIQVSQGCPSFPESQAQTSQISKPVTWPDLDAGVLKATGNDCDKSSKFESEYEVLSLLKKEVAEATFRVKAIKSGADCALRVFKLPKISLDNEMILKHLQSFVKLKHPNIVYYSDLWIEIAPSDWVKRKNWSELKNIDEKEQSLTSTAHTKYRFSQFESNPCPTFVMMLTDLVCEKTLKDWLLRNKQDRTGEVVINFFEQILDAVCYLHEEIEVAHGNLNPSSIYIENELTLKIGDFGLSITNVKDTTSLYSSPDLRSNDGKQADIYALGVIFCELVKCFEDVDRFKVLSQLKEGVCDIQGLGKEVLKLLKLLTCTNPNNRPHALTIQQDKVMMKHLKAEFVLTTISGDSLNHQHVSSTEERKASEPGNTVDSSDLFVDRSLKEKLVEASGSDYSVYFSDVVDIIPPAFQIECPVCLQVLREPFHLMCCGKSICSSCVSRIKHESGPCPCCKKKEYKSFYNLGLQQFLDKLSFYCKNKVKGCKWTGGLKERTKHISECSKRNFKCSFCNDFDSDYDDVTTNHWPVCGCYPVKCPNDCGHSLQRMVLEKHQQYECPQTLVNCEFEVVGCKEQRKRKDMPLHLKESLLAHTSLQCESHKQLVLNYETENSYLRQQNRKLQADISHLNMQLKWVLHTLGKTTHKTPPIGDQGLSSVPDSSAECITEDIKRVVVFSEHRVEQTINWRGATLQGEGIQLIIPENAVKPGVLVTVGLQECLSRHFVIPEEFTLESPIFHISPQYQFQSEVTLVIEHYAYIERESDCADFVFLSSPTKPSIQKSTDPFLWQFHPYAKPKFSTDFQCVSVQLKHFCFASLARKRKKTNKHWYRISLHMPLHFLPPPEQTYAIFCVSLDHESYRKNLDRYLKETFSSQKFHIACRAVKTTEQKIEIIVPDNLEKDQGYKIVSDKGFEILKKEVDSVSTCLRDMKDIAAYPPRLTLKLLLVQKREATDFNKSLDCEIIVKGVPNLPYYHLYLLPADTESGKASIIVESDNRSILNMQDLHKVCMCLKDLCPEHILALGPALGLMYPKLTNMMNIPHDMVAAWLRQEDKVPRNPPTWFSLASALQSIGQTGIANNVKRQYCPTQITTV